MPNYLGLFQKIYKKQSRPMTGPLDDEIGTPFLFPSFRKETARGHAPHTFVYMIALTLARCPVRRRDTKVRRLHPQPIKG